MALSDCERCWETPCGCDRVDDEEDIRIIPISRDDLTVKQPPNSENVGKEGQEWNY